jgi:hypothetical protein
MKKQGRSPTLLLPSGGAGRPQPSHPNAIAAKEAEALIIERLKEQPGLKTSQIAAQTNAKPNTVVERLQRRQAKGLIVREDASRGWTASASP